MNDLKSGNIDHYIDLARGHGEADLLLRNVRLVNVLSGEIHLADVAVFDIIELEVNQNKAAQNTVIKNQINMIVCIVDGNAVLTTDKGKTLAQFQQKGLKMVAEQRFELGFRHLMGFGDFEKFEDIGFTQNIFGLLNDLSFTSQLENTVFVFTGGKS